MPTTFAPVIGLSEEIIKQTCNCHYPIGLVIFLLFTILSLLICICVCCFDLNQCNGYKNVNPERKFRRSSMNARFVEPTKFVIDRKMSLEPCFLEYSQLVNSASLSSSSRSRSFEQRPITDYHTETSCISLV